MPPVSYVLDWLWLRVYGSSEIGFRLFHSAFVIAGVSYLATVAWRELGRWATIVSLGFLALSPKLIQTGVEIRAYPIFFGITCAQTAVFIRLIACPIKVDLKYLTVFAAICLVAIYTHFYGVVSSCAFFLALGISSLRRPVALAQIMGAFFVVAIGSLALVPFISAAAQVPQFVPLTAVGMVIHDKVVLTYLLKLVGDPANMLATSASILFFGGTVALLAASLFTAVIRVRNRNLKPSDWLIAVVGSGVLATIVASLFVSTLDALKSSYSVWLLVPISLLIGAAATSVAGFRSWDVAGRNVAAGALLVGAAISTYLFFDHASWFVHGPQRFVATLYDRAAGPKAIVYETGAKWGWSYIPLQYSQHGQVVQYRVPDEGGGLVRAAPRGAKSTIQGIEATLAPYRVLLLTDIQQRPYQELRQCLNRPTAACPDFPPQGALEGALVGTGKWRKIDKERNFGLWDSQITILERSEN
jgi:hypothetical protein